MAAVVGHTEGPMVSLEMSGDHIRPHPRKITWVGATALAMGGSNQSIFLIALLLSQVGSAAIPILVVGLILSFMATPGWIELSCMFPNRVGGIAATCAEAFRPYSPVLANLTGVSYWWGWVPTCGVTALFSASALQQWYFPHVPLRVLAPIIVLVFMAVNMAGLKWATRVAIPIASVGAVLALLSSLIPVLSGHMDWKQATTWHLISPFHGLFGSLTSVMAGIYLVGFAAPAFEAAASHVGEMKRPAYDQPRAMWWSAGIAIIYFVLLPVVWLGALGKGPLASAASGGLALVLGPTFAPLVGSLAKSFGVWFIFVNMFAGTLQPLSGASRTLSQLSEDALLPRFLGYRHPKTDAPVVAIVITGVVAIAFQFFGSNFENAFIASANLTYLIGIGLPSIAVWVLRRNEPGWPRLYRAKDISIRLGLVAAFVWLASSVLGFEQFGLPEIVGGLVLAYSGAILYFWRLHTDRARLGVKGPAFSLHLKLSGAMILVLALDTFGYGFFVHNVHAMVDRVIVLDIFVTVALLTISVGLVLPGMIAHTALQVSQAAAQLREGPFTYIRDSIAALATGDFRVPVASAPVSMVAIHTRDEFAQMAEAFNHMQQDAVSVTAHIATTAEQLRLQRTDLERLSVVASATDSLIIIANPRGKITWVNAAFERTTGYTLAEVVGRRPGSFLQGPDSDPATSKRIREALRQRVSFTGEILNYTKSGTRYWVTFQITPIFDVDGTLVQFVSVQNDTTERRRREEDVVNQNLELERLVTERTKELRAATAVAEAATEAKSEFLSNMSHEIRTPLNAIIGLTHLTLATPLTDEQQRFVEKTDTAARHLLDLVSDILDFSKLDVHALSLDVAPFDLDRVVAKIEAVSGTMARANGLRFSTMIDPAAPRQLTGDVIRLEQVLLNLTSNATKFTKEGGITVTISLLEPTNSDAHLRFEVRDTGIGISASDLATIFEDFSQADASITRNFGGTGLGLAICRRLVELMGGTIAVDSAVGQGTAFSFDLRFPVSATPVDARDTVMVAAAHDDVLRGARVLVVEDNAFNQLVLEEILKSHGVGVELASDGVEALLALEQRAFDLVLMDLQMPVMDGLTATRRLREDPRNAMLPIIALTANAVSDVREDCLAVGMSDFLTKPVEPSKLLSVVATWVIVSRSHSA